MTQLTNWAVDTAHSNIDFAVKHMMISNVKGSFHTFQAQIAADPRDLTTAQIKLEIETASIDTRNADRDGHLRSPDFFDSETFPKITFEATRIARVGDDAYDVTGQMTIRDVTREETFRVQFEGEGKDPWGNERAAFSGKGVIKRSEYGLTYNSILETGGVLIGDDIKFTIEVEATKA